MLGAGAASFKHYHKFRLAVRGLCDEDRPEELRRMTALALLNPPLSVSREVNTHTIWVCRLRAQIPSSSVLNLHCFIRLVKCDFYKAVRQSVSKSGAIHSDCISAPLEKRRGKVQFNQYFSFWQNIWKTKTQVKGNWGNPIISKPPHSARTDGRNRKHLFDVGRISPKSHKCVNELDGNPGHSEQRSSTETESCNI